MPKRLVPNSDERTNLTPEERRQARKRSYRLLREILRPHRLSLAISVAAVILGAIASAVQPWLIAVEPAHARVPAFAVAERLVPRVIYVRPHNFAADKRY